MFAPAHPTPLLLVTAGRPRSKLRGRLGRVLVVCALWAGLTTVMSGCPSTCEADGDCDQQDGPAVCVNSTCRPLVTAEVQSCDVDADCEGRGAWVCAGGTCAIRPTCQIIGGPFDVVLECEAAGTRRTTANVTTEACAVRIDIPSESLSYEVGTLESAPISGQAFTTAGCAGGTWSAAGSVFSLDDCAVDGDVCDMALLAEKRGGVPCVIGQAGHCDADETCAVGAGITRAGVCQ